MVKAETGDRGAVTAHVLTGRDEAAKSRRPSILKSGREWALRDAVAAAGLFLATAGVILWQNTHVAVLWDFSYVLDSAVRMADGQMPYRDFPFVHAPLTFLVQAAILRLTGRIFLHQVLSAALVGGLGTVLTWRIALDRLRGRTGGNVAVWTVALLLAAPLTVLGIYCILPLPNYDCDCVFSILAAVWLLQGVVGHPDSLTVRTDSWAARPGSAVLGSRLRGFAAGVAVCLPLFFKQNIGLPFLLAVIAALVLLLGLEYTARGSAGSRGHRSSSVLAMLAGVGATLAAAALLLHLTAGIGNYYHWTIQFAAQRRLPRLRTMLGIYLDPNLLWTLPCVAAGLLLLRRRIGNLRWARIPAFVFLAAPFVFTLCSLWPYEDADERGDSLLALWPLLLILAAALAITNLWRAGRGMNLRTFLPFFLLAAINGTMLSQQLWGSTYAIWPLLVLLLAELIAFLAAIAPKNIAYALTALISATLLVCGGFYTASEERLSYAQFPAGPVEHSAFPQLAGMATPGPYLPEFDELLRYASAKIPFDDGLIVIPGEDPFYFATGRVPRFPVLLFDPSTDPYSPAEIAELVRRHNTRWLIVKRDLQINEDPSPQRQATMKALMTEFTMAAHLRGYDVYRR